MACLYHLGQNCLHLTIYPYLRSETYSRKNEKLLNIVFHACTNTTEKNEFVENKVVLFLFFEIMFQETNDL